MLKLKKKKGSEVKAEVDSADDAVQAFLDDWLADFCKDHPELADAISAPLITKSALDSALDGGVYKIDSNDVADRISEIRDQFDKRQQNKSRQNKHNKNNKSKKGLKKPHTDI